jgi:hypothetical protein
MQTRLPGNQPRVQNIKKSFFYTLESRCTGFVLETSGLARGCHNFLCVPSGCTTWELSARPAGGAGASPQLRRGGTARARGARWQRRNTAWREGDQHGRALSNIRVPLGSTCQSLDASIQATSRLLSAPPLVGSASWRREEERGRRETRAAGPAGVECEPPECSTLRSPEPAVLPRAAAFH